ncbi:hypothetical protein QN277_004008 [Acacia crassicarpa]|uniref:Uncharacterized protein n=1 Tax=Acacia crassicarpa TaxID=499986 RepID=A0AAE1MD69_9FABA|nr:hypothetical protein QN277_004008 [Acacia crassicarpa]
MCKPHILIFPFPTKGHLLPLLDLTHPLALSLHHHHHRHPQEPPYAPPSPLRPPHHRLHPPPSFPFSPHPPSRRRKRPRTRPTRPLPRHRRSLQVPGPNPPVVQIPPFTFNSTSF